MIFFCVFDALSVFTKTTRYTLLLSVFDSKSTFRSRSGTKSRRNHRFLRGGTGRCSRTPCRVVFALSRSALGGSANSAHEYVRRQINGSCGTAPLAHELLRSFYGCRDLLSDGLRAHPRANSLIQNRKIKFLPPVLSCIAIPLLPACCCCCCCCCLLSATISHYTTRQLANRTSNLPIDRGGSGHFGAFCRNYIYRLSFSLT